jgi:hypothetical protein
MENEIAPCEQMISVVEAVYVRSIRTKRGRVRSYKSTSYAKTRHLSASHQRGRRTSLRGRLYLDRLSLQVSVRIASS